MDPFSEMSLAKVSNDLNFLLGIAMSGFGKKGEPVKVEGAIWLSSSSAIPDITGLFSVSPEKVGLSKGKFTGLYVEFQDTMFDATADWTVMINIATKEERKDAPRTKELHARTELETNWGGPVDIALLCKKLVEVTQQTYSKVVIK